MDVFHGECIICCKDTFVFSENHTKKFVQLLKRHYFDVNKITNDKISYLFKQKCTRKSMCISCVYIIEKYVNIRNKFKNNVYKKVKNCSICNNNSYVIQITNEIKDSAFEILKSENKKLPRISQICLECCFCITSWNKLKNLLGVYKEDEKEETQYLRRNRKRKQFGKNVSTENNSLDDDIETLRRSTRTSINKESEQESYQVTNKKKRKTNKQTSVSKTKKRKVDNGFTKEKQLKHLSKVRDRMVSKNICVNDNVSTDNKMMTDIPYISCETLHTKSLNNNTTYKRRSIRILKKEQLVNVIQISDTESESEKKKIKLKVKKKKITSHSKMKSTTNTCSVCKKTYAKKYKLQLHVLEHKTSYNPRILIQKLNLDVIKASISNIQKITNDKQIEDLTTTYTEKNDNSTAGNNDEYLESQGENQDKIETDKQINTDISLLTEQVDESVIDSNENMSHVGETQNGFKDGKELSGKKGENISTTDLRESTSKNSHHYSSKSDSKSEEKGQEDTESDETNEKIKNLNKNDIYGVNESKDISEHEKKETEKIDNTENKIEENSKDKENEKDKDENDKEKNINDLNTEPSSASVSFSESNSDNQNKETRTINKKIIESDKKSEHNLLKSNQTIDKANDNKLVSVTNEDSSSDKNENSTQNINESDISENDHENSSQIESNSLAIAEKQSLNINENSITDDCGKSDGENIVSEIETGLDILNPNQMQSENTNTSKTKVPQSDKFEIVESLLQNLGA